MRLNSDTRDRIYVVTGAPGSGKTTALNEFLKLESGHVAFDDDWLAIGASNLAGRDIIFDRSTWKTYRGLWVEILRCICRNHRSPIFFTSWDQTDIDELGDIGWEPAFEWLLLDCADSSRTERLLRRPFQWTEQMIEEALQDAARLRAAIPNRVDTDARSPSQVARLILAWINRKSL